MDNNELLDQIQKLLEGFESRVDARFQIVEQGMRDLNAEMQRLTARVDVVTGLTERLVPAFLSHFQQANKTEAEFRLRLSSLEARVNRLDQPRQ